MTEHSPVTTEHPRPNTGDSPPLTDKATDAAEAAKQASADVAQTAAAKAKDVAHETGKQARDLAGDAREQVRQQAATQHRALVLNLRSLDDELSGMTDGAEQPGVATEAVSQIRDRVRGAADWLDGREPGDLVDELRSLARRRPGAFLFGALAAGVVTGRLTRGVVAAHADTAGSGGTSNERATQPAVAPTTEHPAAGYASDGTGYAVPAGNGESGYGTPPAYVAQPGYGAQPGYSAEPGYGVPPAGGYPQADAPQSREG